MITLKQATLALTITFFSSNVALAKAKIPMVKEKCLPRFMICPILMSIN